MHKLKTSSRSIWVKKYYRAHEFLLMRSNIGQIWTVSNILPCLLLFNLNHRRNIDTYFQCATDVTHRDPGPTTRLSDCAIKMNGKSSILSSNESATFRVNKVNDFATYNLWFLYWRINKANRRIDAVLHQIASVATVVHLLSYCVSLFVSSCHVAGYFVSRHWLIHCHPLYSVLCLLSNFHSFPSIDNLKIFPCLSSRRI